MNKTSPAFYYLKKILPKVSDAKLNECTFIGTQIRLIFQDKQFEALLNSLEKANWESFKTLLGNFCGNHKSKNYREMVVNLVKSYYTSGCNMFLKVYFLDSHLYFFPDIL